MKIRKSLYEQGSFKGECDNCGERRTLTTYEKAGSDQYEKVGDFCSDQCAEENTGMNVEA